MSKLCAAFGTNKEHDMKAFVMAVVVVAVALGACRREAPVDMYEDDIEYSVPKK